MPAFLFLVAGASAFAPPPVTQSAKNWNITLQFFDGTLQGFFEPWSPFPHPGKQRCAGDVTGAFFEINKAMNEIDPDSGHVVKDRPPFESAMTPAGVKAGIKDLAKAYGGMKASLVACKNWVGESKEHVAELNVAKLALALETGFEHPATFLFEVGEKLVVNGQDIYGEVTAAVADWKASPFLPWRAGLQIGRALSKLLVQDFDAWKLRHAKKYATEAAEASAREAFLLSVDLVRAAHLQHAAGVGLHLNEYADLTPAAFNTRNGYSPWSTQTLFSEYVPYSVHKPSGAPVPAAVDWRAKGLVADVKNQGTCSSCWAFSTVVSIEGQLAKRAGKVTPLSEQNLVDCVIGVQQRNDEKENEGSETKDAPGCMGGLMDDAFDYLLLKQRGAIDTEAAYPYTGRAGTCVYAPNSWTSDSWAKTAASYRRGASIGGWTEVPAGDEAALLDAVATVGPVSIAVDASIGWQLYFGGVMRPLLCSSDPKKMDHGVAIVGFGTEGGEDYWIVRNSWGAHWGENGYARIIRGKNACGLANSASYPTSVTGNPHPHPNPNPKSVAEAKERAEFRLDARDLMWTDDVVHYSYDDGSSYSDPALIDFSVDDLSVAHLSVDDLSVDDLIVKLSADYVVTVDDLTVDDVKAKLTVDDVKAKLTVDDLMVDGIAVDDWLFVVDGELLDYDHNPLGSLRNDTLHAYGHMADDVRKAGVSVDPLAFDDKFEAPYSGPDFEAYYYYWEVRRPQIEAHKAKLAREEAEASKLERAPADDRAPPGWAGMDWEREVDWEREGAPLHD